MCMILKGRLAHFLRSHIKILSVCVNIQPLQLEEKIFRKDPFAIVRMKINGIN